MQRFNVNGIDFSVHHMNVRGKGTLEYRRKSFDVYFQKKEKENDNNNNFTNVVTLISMVEDLGYYRDYLAFTLMKEIVGIFPLFFEYTKVWINEQMEGLYLVVQHPRHYVFQTIHNGIFIASRWHGGNFPEKEIYCVEEGNEKKNFNKMVAKSFQSG